jgi:hypothetical protein
MPTTNTTTTINTMQSITALWLPIEMWLKVVSYADTNTFETIISVLGKNEAMSLLTFVCSDIVKYSPKITMMNRLVNDFDYYLKRNNYLDFISEYIHSDSINNQAFNNFILYDKHVLSYQMFIIESIYENNTRLKKLFTNLTRPNMTIITQRVTHFKYYNVYIPIETIFRHTYQHVHQACK